MPDAINQLCRSARSRRARWDKVPWCSVSIELKAVTRQDRCFVGIALIDRRQVGWLVNGEPRSFRLEPGEHAITVYMAGSATITARPRPMISRRFVLQPRDNVRLVCARTSQAMAIWMVRQSHVKSWRRALFGGSIFFAALGWLIYPSLREAVANATLRLEIGQPWLSLLYLLVKSRTVTTMLGCLCWALMVVAAMMVQEFRLMKLLEYRSLEPYFLVRMPASTEASTANTFEDGV
jgi:hypothetical protein